MNKEELFLSDFNKMLELRRALGKLNRRAHLPDYHYTEILCISLIGTLPEANVTKLSEASYMTRGGISKTIKKLINYGVVESYQKPENKKEIYFELTDKGKEIFTKNEQFTEAQEDIYKSVFNELAEEEKNSVIKFLKTLEIRLMEEIDKSELLNEEFENE
ncbi:MAG: winged helix DNA-binding protein [Bacillota bacterium]|nr:winged helix DNA-binding protein [Bacillota bacterium]